MALLRLRELRGMDAAALKTKREELEREVARQRGLTKTTGKPENSGKMHEMRRTVARINTLLGQRKTQPTTKTTTPAKSVAKPTVKAQSINKGKT